MSEAMTRRWAEYSPYLSSPYPYFVTTSMGGAGQPSFVYCERFAEEFPDSREFLIEQLQGEDPTLAAHAFRCLLLVDPDLTVEDLPPEVPWRWETVALGMGCTFRWMELGQIIRNHWVLIGPDERENLYRLGP